MSSIEFSLFAPYNAKAALKGDFSDWNEISMEKTEDGTFHTQVDLADGTYHYVFKVQSKSWFFDPDTWVEIIDPYATAIDDANQNGVIRLKEGERIVDTYVWQHDDKPLPGNHELVIYEMHVGDFSGGEPDDDPRGKFQHVVEKLDYLAELGINAVELMPIQEFPGDRSWGYNPRHFFAPESSYGTTADLKQLIDECHSRGMRVIFDSVLNHAESESPLTKIDYDYWFHHEPQDPDNTWGPEFNYEHYDENLETYPARKFAGDQARFWIHEYHIDGIRYDAAKQIDNYDFMHWIVQESKRTAGIKPFYNIAEHVPETTAITNKDGPMDGCWHTSFYYTLQDLLCKGEYDADRLKDVLDPRRQGFMDATNVVNYLSNHDHDRLMVTLGNNEVFEDAAFCRIRLGMSLLMTAVGIPMLWMGEEFGEYKAKTIESAKLDWSLFENDENQRLFDFVKGLIQLRTENYALQTSNIEFFFEDTDSKILSYVRWNDEGARVVIIANFSDQYYADYEVTQFPEDGNWHEWTRDYDVEVSGARLTLDLAEYEAKVFVR